MIRVAVSACIEHEGRHVLVRRRNPPAQGLWAFPGGSVQAGETVAQAVAREVREETGLLVVDIEPWLVHDLMPELPGQPQFVLIVCRARIDGPTGLVAGDDAAEARWVHPDEAAHLPMPDSMHRAFEQLQRRSSSREAD